MLRIKTGEISGVSQAYNPGYSGSKNQEMVV
jgi:hypothetical protein